MLIIRRSDCINTASGTVLSVTDRPLCRLRNWSVPPQPARRTVTYKEYYTRYFINTIRPPDDEHSVARKM